MTTVLRPYQLKTLEKLLKDFERYRSLYFVYATGLGKTVTFSSVIPHFTAKKILIVVHSDNLVRQAVRQVKSITDLECAVEKAGLWIEPDLFHSAQVIVSTVQTLNAPWDERKRMGRFNPNDFGLVIFDECHHGAANTWRNVWNYFGQNQGCKLLGVTATPDRFDGKGIEGTDALFEFCSDSYDIAGAVPDGWLVRGFGQEIDVQSLDLSHVRKFGDDLNGRDLEEVLEQEKVVQGMGMPSLEFIYRFEKDTLKSVPTELWGARLTESGRAPMRTLMFTASVRQAEMASELFNRIVPGVAEVIHGKTPIDTRLEIVKRFQTGVTHILCNCGIFLEGWDEPTIECILLARPTRSMGLMIQMVGRGLRSLPGVIDNLGDAEPSARREAIKDSAKPGCYFVDYLGICGKLRLARAAHVLAGGYSDEVIRGVYARAKAKGKPVDLANSVKIVKHAQEVERLKKIQEAQQRAKQIEADRKKHVIVPVNYSSKSFDMHAPPEGDLGFKYSKNGKKVYPGILVYLRKRGEKFPESLPYGKAMQLFHAHKAKDKKVPADSGQLYMIRKLGGEPPDGLTRFQASEMLKELHKQVA